MADLECRIRWAEREDKDANPLEFYRQHYDGLTRGQLGKRDSGLYQRLGQDNLLENIPRVDRSQEVKALSRFGIDPLAYYRQHYEDVTRGELRREDNSLYVTLHRARLLQQVPVKIKNFGKNSLAYYQEHYRGLTRGLLSKKDPSLYQRLRKDKLLGKIPVIKMGKIINPRELGELIRQGLRSSGKNQTWLFQQLKVSKRSVSDYVRGKYVPSEETLQKLRGILGIEYTLLLE